MTTEPIPIPDAAFELPAYIPSPHPMRELYEVIVARLRREAAHLQMGTLQELLIERIAFNYIVMRWREQLGDGEVGAFEHTTAAKAYQQFWLDMTREFNRLVRGSDDEYRKVLFRQIAAVVNGALSDVDPVVASQLRERLAAAFEGTGL